MWIKVKTIKGNGLGYLRHFLEWLSLRKYLECTEAGNDTVQVDWKPKKDYLHEQ